MMKRPVRVPELITEGRAENLLWSLHFDRVSNFQKNIGVPSQIMDRLQSLDLHLEILCKNFLISGS